MALCVQRVWNENKNGTGAMDTAKNEVFIGFKHEICYVVGGKKSGFFSAAGEGLFRQSWTKYLSFPTSCQTTWYVGSYKNPWNDCNEKQVLSWTPKIKLLALALQNCWIFFNFLDSFKILGKIFYLSHRSS